MHDEVDKDDRNHAFDNNYDLDVHEPGDLPAMEYFLVLVYYTSIAYYGWGSRHSLLLYRALGFGHLSICE
jgi:hypothetical protein